LASGLIEIEPLDRKRAGGALRVLHGSNALRTAVYCFRIVFAMEPRFGAMHFRLFVGGSATRS